MLYIDELSLPGVEIEERSPDCREYPFAIFPPIGLGGLRFGQVTVVCGGNGSGKSTLLGVLADILRLPRTEEVYHSEAYLDFLELCKCTREGREAAGTLPPGSRMITSNDVFGKLLRDNRENLRVRDEREKAEDVYLNSKFGHVKFDSMERLEELKAQNLARRRSAARFVRDRAGDYRQRFSNGESALMYFERAIENDALYLLDEPENSMSPSYQILLARLISDSARFSGCQFVIATHSPFIMALPNAVVCDLDADPARVRPWSEVAGMREYWRFFTDHSAEFEDGGERE